MFGQPTTPQPAPVAPTVPATRARTEARSGWAVIAATYGGYQGAEKRAAAIRHRWPEFQPVIYPREGEGRRYYVVLGSGLTKDQASALHRRARQAGMAGDTYVTKLGG
jgi:cell division septation protein DedD